MTAHLERIPGEDAVAGILRQWAHTHPDLDFAPVAVMGRLSRCAALLQQVSDAPLGRAELSRPEFDILCTLRRAEGEVTPGRIARETFASPAAVTKRLKVLEARGLVARRADGRDRRVAHLSLTETGLELVDQLLPHQLSYEESLLNGLAPADRAEVARILGDLLLMLEGRLGGLDR
jgi:DNA-binding MarR family transcriptional regulator